MFVDKIEELLTRGVEKIYPSSNALEKVLRSGKKLRLYQGFDPTGTELHIGHMVGLRKLRQWQDLGHHVIFLIGDGTGQAGDPSGKEEARKKFLTRNELRSNAVDYVKQAGKIVRFDGKNPVEILFNGDWLNKLGLVDILNIAGHFSLQQLVERDLYRDRAKRGKTVNLREFLYPLLQAYDSVAMKVDLELGGSDQTFNMLMGRHLVKAMQHREKFVMTTPLLTDAQGNKIGKTEGNAISFTDNPIDLFAKIMALPDDIIAKGLEYLTDIPMGNIQQIKDEVKKRKHVISHKKKLAFEILKQIKGHDDAHKAQEEFEKVIQKGESPTSIPTIFLSKSFISSATVASATFEAGLASSNSDVKRVIVQKGLKINDTLITNPSARLSDYLKNGEAIIQRGPKRIKIEVK